MRKFLALTLCLLTVIPMALVGCGKTEPATVQFGAGEYISDVTYAAVTVDANGKIVACELDTASNTVNFTTDGKAVANNEFKTKYELGNDYNMVKYGGSAKEWFEQADAFEKVVVGKTLDEVKALVVNGDKGTDEVLTAGCRLRRLHREFGIQHTHTRSLIPLWHPLGSSHVCGTAFSA